MFATAYGQAAEYTLPVIFSRLHYSKQISSGCGTCIVLNTDGWILTAYHIARETSIMDQHGKELAAFHQEVDAINGNEKLHPNDKRKRLKALKPNPQWITNQAIMWGLLQSRIKNFHVNAFADIAIGRLEPFDPSWIKTYPVFKNPTEPMPAGTSLCRLGFPFHQVDATYDEQTRKFKLAEGVLPVPRFPNEGIHTRIVEIISPDGKTQTKFIETSSPGLRGQSGGPIFDAQGHIWAMQSRTQHLELGFAPEVIEGNRTVVEHQFMHVGWGTHVEEIIGLCKMYGVKLSLSS